MKAERRDTPRIPLVADILLNLNRRGFERYQCKNISLDGVFVETSGKPLPKKNHVEMAIKLPVAGRNKLHRFIGRVVRVTNQGSGFVFDRVDTDGYSALLELVFSRQTKSAW